MVEVKGKVKGHLRTDNEGPEGEQRYNYTLPSTSALDGVSGQRHNPAALNREGSCSHCIGGRVAPGTVWTGAENLAPTQIRSPDLQTRSECLYRLSYPGPQNGYTGCPRRNVPDFGRVFLMLKYTDITQNTFVQS